MRPRCSRPTTRETASVAALVARVSRLIGLLQQGRIAVYLLFSFLTLVLTLIVVKR